MYFRGDLYLLHLGRTSEIGEAICMEKREKTMIWIKQINPNKSRVGGITDLWLKINQIEKSCRLQWCIAIVNYCNCKTVHGNVGDLEVDKSC